MHSIALVLLVGAVTAGALPAVSQHDLLNATDSRYAAFQNWPTGFASVGGGTYGGNLGSVVTVSDAASFRNAVSDNTPRTVRINGRIDLATLFTGSPGVWVDVGSFKTITNAHYGAEITGGGLRIRRAQQVIVRNLKLTNALSFAPGEQPNGSGGIRTAFNTTRANDGDFTEIDAISIEQSEHVWIDHCEFSDDPWVAVNVPTGQNRHDGLIDVKRASNWITISNNIFRNHNKVLLIGHSDNNAAQDVGFLKTSLVGNWFQGVEQRNPRVRYAEVHVLNNLYTDLRSYGIGAGAGSMIYAERNVFINTRRSWRHPDGTPNPMGYLYNFNNLLLNSQFDAVPQTGISWWNPSWYFQYSAIGNNLVENRVRTQAGIF